MIQQGVYAADIISAKSTVSRNNTPMIEIEFCVVLPDGEAVERTIYIYLSESAKPKSREKLEFLKFNGDFDAPQFGVNKQILLRCTHEVYQNVPREKWELASWKVENTPASDTLRRSLESWWKAKTPPVPPPDDDTIPF